ncbi:MAG: glycosyltransferase family 39 protein [Thermodesulfobacteriota bacterium]
MRHASLGAAGPLVAVLIAAGVLLRFTALDFGWGVPNARPDENGVFGTLTQMDEGRLFPPLVAYGGGYFYPLDAVLHAAAAVTGRSARSLHDLYSNGLLVARAWSAALSSVTLALTYVVGRQVGGRVVGAVAAALLAATPLAVREAHFAKADTAAAAMVTLFLVAATRSWRSDGTRALAVGASAGLALSTKLCAGVLPAAALAVVAGSRAHAARRLVVAA